MKKKHAEIAPAMPLVRLRSMVLWMVLLAVLISGPLLLVWKQVYINTASLQMNTLADSLLVLQKEVATLQLRCERFAATERIEKFAREALELEYPLSSQIMIVSVPPENRNFRILYRPKEILAYLRKTMRGDRG